MAKHCANDDLIPELLRPGSGELWVGFSGGLDSTVLLHVLAQRGQHPLAIHVHHGLQEAADEWVAHCESFCRRIGVEFHALRVQVPADGSGPESAARDARYAAVRSLMQAGDVFATAHHQDDQAETVLLRLLRGTGPTGLAAMRKQVEWAPGWLWRPLLDAPRSRLERYAQTHGLPWVDDPHNTNPRFARSFLRHEVMPRLQSHWPGAARNLARTAALAADAADLLRELAALDLARVASSSEALSITGLLELSPARRHNLLRGWVEGLGLPMPFHDTLLRVESEVLRAAPDAQPLLAWPGGEFRRYRDLLYAMPPLPPVPANFRVEWDGSGDIALPPGCGFLRPNTLPRDRYLVRLAQPGDRLRLAGSSHRRSFKNRFQEKGIAPWVRERTPVIEQLGVAWWVGGIGSAIQPEREGFEIEWRERPPGAPDG